MLEKLLFKKIELWILALTVLVLLLAMMLFGWEVNLATQNSMLLPGGKKPGWIRQTALEIALVPTHIKRLLKSKSGFDQERAINIENINAYDFMTKTSVRAFPLDYYHPVLSDEKTENPPIMWSKPGVSFDPVAVLLRINDKKDERLVIFDQQRRVVRSFPIFGESMDAEHPALLGVSETFLLPDNSMIVFPIGGVGLYRKDLCGKILWSIKGIFHHNYSVVDGKLYILGQIKDHLTEVDFRVWNEAAIINEIDIATGKVLRNVSMDEIAQKNMVKFDPLFWERWRGAPGRINLAGHSYLHLNKIDVLSQAMAHEYPEFPSGAWLLSLRNINMTMVIDPKTLEILWFDHGHTQVQHDPHFVGKNTIAVFNNASKINSTDAEAKANFSSLRSYNFATKKWQDIFNGSPLKAFSFHMGNFDISPHGDYLVNVSTQGRYLEVTKKGELLSAIVNIRDKDSVYWTKHAQYLSNDQFEALKGTICH